MGCIDCSGMDGLAARGAFRRLGPGERAIRHARFDRAAGSE